MLIICDSIKKKELTPLELYFGLGQIKEAAGKALSGLGLILPSPMKNTKLIKVYLTGRRGAGRIIYLLYRERNITPIILRLKSDKKVGENMSMNNQDFVKVLKKNIALAIEDMDKGQIMEYPLD